MREAGSRVRELREGDNVAGGCENLGKVTTSPAAARAAALRALRIGMPTMARAQHRQHDGAPPSGA
jgi:hypothetical protein